MRVATAMLMVAMAAPAAAQTAPPGPGVPGVIVTHATARGRLANTVADVSIGVEAHAPTVGAAQAALASGSGRLMTYLRDQGVERLRTEQLSVTPQTVSDKGQPTRIVGYDGRVQASFRVPVDRVGAVTAGALANGGNDLAGTTMLPRETELDAERARLAAEAAKIALAQAEAVAAAAGRRLGAVRRIEVDPDRGYVTPRPMMRAAVAAPMPASPVATEAGDAEINATVSVTVELVEPRSP